MPQQQQGAVTQPERGNRRQSPVTTTIEIPGLSGQGGGGQR
jgi:hypothetical protein